MAALVQGLIMFTNKMVSVAAVIVIFNPDSILIDSVIELSKQVKKIFLIDNCSESRSYIETIAGLNIDGLEFVLLDNNYGIGYALNRGAELAADSGYTWLLTLDQDTIIPPDYIDNVITFVNGHKNIFSVCARYGDVKDDGINIPYQKILYSITSGHVLSLEKLKSVGGYDEELFIDGVDFDIFLKLKLHGVDTYLLNSYFLKHRLGDEPISFPFLNRVHTYHSPLRRYYIYRNTIVLAKRYYAHFTIFVVKSIMASCLYLLTILFLGRRRKDSLKMIVLGLWDGVRGKLGKKI